MDQQELKPFSLLDAQEVRIEMNGAIRQGIKDVTEANRDEASMKHKAIITLRVTIALDAERGNFVVKSRVVGKKPKARVLEYARFPKLVNGELMEAPEVEGLFDANETLQQKARELAGTFKAAGATFTVTETPRMQGADLSLVGVGHDENDGDGLTDEDVERMAAAEEEEHRQELERLEAKHQRSGGGGVSAGEAQKLVKKMKKA